MPKVSIIIPIYNVEKYIGRCLQSVVGQSFYDIEIICVDDCSPDNSLQIVQKYAKQDKRIKIIKNPKNLRLGKTREAGFFASSGEYVTFVDSDDTICFDYIEKLYDKAKQTGAEVVKGNVKMIHNNGASEILDTNKKLSNALQNKLPLILYGQSAPWSFLIQKDFLLKYKIMPDEIDGDFCIGNRILHNVKNLVIVFDTFYNYYYGQETSFSGQNNESGFDIRFNLISSKIKMINSFYIDKKTYIAYIQMHLEHCFSCLKQVCANYDKSHTYKYINEFIRVFNVSSDCDTFGGGECYDDCIQLTIYDKEKYIFDLMNKKIRKAIKTNDCALLFNILHLINNNKTEKLLLKCCNLIFFSKHLKIKSKEKVKNRFKQYISLFRIK